MYRRIHRQLLKPSLLLSKQFSTQPLKSSVSAKEDARILKSLVAYIWPANDRNTKLRVCASLGMLVAGKFVSVSVPFFFKHVIDSLNANSTALIDVSSQLHIMDVCGTVLIGYGLARLSSQFFNEAKNAVFASVAQTAIQSAANSIFNHLLHLDSKFHLSRQTGIL